MKIGVLKTIQKEELSKFGEIPKWVDPFLQAINQFFGSVGLALKGNLSFQDNFLCTQKALTFTHNVEQAINPESKNRVIGVIPIASGGLAVDSFGWVQKSDGTIGVTFKFVSGTSAICTVIILLG